MTIKRLRRLPTAKKLAALYAEPHDHRLYGHGHHLRVEQSIVFLNWVWDWQKLSTIADLSCGNGAIAKSVKASASSAYLGDFADGYEFAGPIEKTINDLPEVDLFVCSETLEHLDDPELVLSLIREKTKWLLLTTPINNWGDKNKEHLWSWDREGVESLLSKSSFTSQMFSSLDSTVIGEAYVYGIWVCS